MCHIIIKTTALEKKLRDILRHHLFRRSSTGATFWEIICIAFLIYLLNYMLKHHYLLIYLLRHHYLLIYLLRHHYLLIYLLNHHITRPIPACHITRMHHLKLPPRRKGIQRLSQFARCHYCRRPPYLLRHLLQAPSPCATSPELLPYREKEGVQKSDAAIPSCSPPNFLEMPLYLLPDSAYLL